MQRRKEKDNFSLIISNCCYEENGIRKIAPRKIVPKKITPLQENWPPESFPLLKYPPMNIPLYECSPCENYPPEICPLEKITPMNSPPHLEIIQMKEKPKLQKLLLRRKLCNTKALGKHQNNQGLLWYSDDLTENTGLRYFLYKMKKSKNWTKAKIAKWHLLASCTSQGELKLGSQTIKFGKYVKIPNNELTLHITLWI